ncbi:CAAX prenyl protease [Martiniozyma asiatica (nom. inval.)]|nr:CAAX prenyl protease [Martiniozyma asiatica]
MEKFTLTLLYVLIVTNLYVAILYFRAPKGDRNDPPVIKSRIVRVSCFTTVVIIVTPFVLMYIGSASNVNDAYEILGFPKLDLKCLWQMAKTLALFAWLFMGPLIHYSFEGEISDLHESKLAIWRDLVIAPITEEIVYTSLSLAPFLAIIPENEKLLYLTPLLFGSAHLHHFYTMTTRTNPPPNPIGASIIICLFQLLYTTLFGYLTNRVFVQTNNVWCCALAHAFCNYLGFPILDIGMYYGNFIRILYWLSLVVGIIGFTSFFALLN